MTASPKSSPIGTLIALTAQESLGVITTTERRALAKAQKSSSPQARAAASAYSNLPLALAAGAPVLRAPAGLKAKVLAAISDNSRSTLAPARGVGFFSYASESGAWRDHAVPGVQFRVLSVNRGSDYAMTLYKLNPGTVFPEHHHSGAEECFVLAGDLHVDGRVLHEGDFHHAEKHTDHGVSVTEGGCTLLIIAAAGDYS